MFKLRAPVITPFPTDLSWLRQKIWIVKGVLRWVAYFRMKRFLEVHPHATPEKVALLNVMIACAGLIVLNAGWGMLSKLGIIPLAMGLGWILLLHPFVKGVYEDDI